MVSLIVFVFFSVLKCKLILFVWSSCVKRKHFFLKGQGSVLAYTQRTNILFACLLLFFQFPQWPLSKDFSDLQYCLPKMPFLEMPSFVLTRPYKPLWFLGKIRTEIVLLRVLCTFYTMFKHNNCICRHKGYRILWTEYLVCNLIAFNNLAAKSFDVTEQLDFDA